VSADLGAQGGAVSAQLQAKIDDAVRAMLDAQAVRAERIVRQYRAAVSAIADALMEREVLTAAEVHEIAAQHGIGSTPEAGVLTAA
jgi:ATP-dependent Zn protease